MVTARKQAQPLPLPRAQSGPAPQRLLMTLIGDYWYWRREPLPSAALVDLLALFDISEGSARMAVRRLVGRGLLVGSKRGRTTSYAMPARSREVMVAHHRRLLDFGATWPAWDGEWSVVAFSVPEGERETRRTFTDALRLQGFGPLFDALWVSPHDRLGEVRALAATMGVRNVNYFRSRELSGASPRELASRSFDLDDLRGDYQSLVTRIREIRRELSMRDPRPERALLLRTEVMTAWRPFPTRDPGLPRDLLPDDWPLAEARALTASVYDTLGMPASLAFRRVLGHHAPELADLVGVHTFATGSVVPEGLHLGEDTAESFEAAITEHRRRVLTEGG